MKESVKKKTKNPQFVAGKTKIVEVVSSKAKYIAENQNASPRYDCTLIKEDKSDVEDEEITIKEVQ